MAVRPVCVHGLDPLTMSRCPWRASCAKSVDDALILWDEPMATRTRGSALPFARPYWP